MFSNQSNTYPQLPRDLRFYLKFTQASLDNEANYLVVEFERMASLDQPDQYYVMILPFDAPVISSDPQAAFGAALAWDCAPNPVVLAKKISAWLGEGL